MDGAGGLARLREAKSTSVGRKPASVLPAPVGAISSASRRSSASFSNCSWCACGCQPRCANQAGKGSGRTRASAGPGRFSPSACKCRLTFAACFDQILLERVDRDRAGEYKGDWTWNAYLAGIGAGPDRLVVLSCCGRSFDALGFSPYDIINSIRQLLRQSTTWASTRSRGRFAIPARRCDRVPSLADRSAIQADGLQSSRRRRRRHRRNRGA